LILAMNNVLLGVTCLDIYTRTGLVRPGCGILHNAYHLQQLGSNPLLITRIGHNHAATFLNFFHRHHISILADQIQADGLSASIEIDVQPSGEAMMSNFERGVWADFRLTPTEEEILAGAQHLHLVLARGVAPEFLRISRSGLLNNTLVSADFLSFRDFSVESFTELLVHLKVAFIGWKSSLQHPTIAAIGAAAAQLGRLVVITLGERGIQVFNGPHAEFYPIEPVAVAANTNGCGDAFIAYFLHEYWQNRRLAPAIAGGKIGGQAATAWRFALPDSAYTD